MTFLEKFQKEHPELEIKSWRDIPQTYFGDATEGKCPMNIGYESKYEGSEACGGITCDGCWNRQVPETEVNPAEVIEASNDDKEVIVWLTKQQCKTLAEFIETESFNVIRNDPRIDGFEWLRNMINAHMALTKALKE